MNTIHVLEVRKISYKKLRHATNDLSEVTSQKLKICNMIILSKVYHMMCLAFQRFLPKIKNAIQTKSTLEYMLQAQSYQVNLLTRCENTYSPKILLIKGKNNSTYIYIYILIKVNNQSIWDIGLLLVLCQTLILNC